MNQFTYTGTELELFAQAKKWKKYIRSLLRKYLKGDVLEVGAGIGNNTRLLNCPHYNKWLCLEPDPKNFKILEDLIALNDLKACYAQQGTIDSLKDDQIFDSILYLDVLEHIPNDKEEVIRSSQHLKPEGNLIILSPAHQWLFTPFDTAIGHYRRYNKSTIKNVLPSNIEIIYLAYLDCFGLLASLGNKLILKQSQPTLKQIKTWDNFLVPLSRRIDPILGYNIGKSLLLVGRKIF